MFGMLRVTVQSILEALGASAHTFLSQPFSFLLHQKINLNLKKQTKPNTFLCRASPAECNSLINLEDFSASFTKQT